MPSSHKSTTTASENSRATFTSTDSKVYESWYSTPDYLDSRVDRFMQDVEIFKFEWANFASAAGIEELVHYVDIDSQWWRRYGETLKLNVSHFRMLQDELKAVATQVNMFKAVIKKRELPTKAKVQCMLSMLWSLQRQYSILRKSDEKPDLDPALLSEDEHDPWRWEYKGFGKGDKLHERKVLGRDLAAGNWPRGKARPESKQ